MSPLLHRCDANYARQIALQRFHAVGAKVPAVNGGGHVTRPQGEEINQMLGLKQVGLYELQADGYCTRFIFLAADDGEVEFCDIDLPHGVFCSFSASRIAGCQSVAQTWFDGIGMALNHEYAF